MSDIKKLAERATELDELATAGPWHAGVRGHPQGALVDITHDRNDARVWICSMPMRAGNRVDGDFIAEARTGYPALAREVLRLRERLTRVPVLTKHQAIAVLTDCNKGLQRCNVCPALGCCDNDARPPRKTGS